MKSVLKIVGVAELLFTTFATFTHGQTRATLQEQKMCYEQAKKIFDTDPPSFPASRSFTSHYSRRMNACYMEETTVILVDGKIVANIHAVRDAFEGVDVGVCDLDSDRNIKDGDCYVYPSRMHSFREFITVIRRATGLYGGGD